MRLDARKGDVGWYVFDCARCRPVESVVWCDDETARWGYLLLRNAILVRQEQRISIYPQRRLVLFNEIELNGDEDLAVTTEELTC